jgi:NADP-dependent 3-hydroxy acid dehydrogenase YdfG
MSGEWLRNRNVGITGHTAGVGAAIAEALTARGHSVTGYSLENGFDLWHGDQTIERIVADASDKALFINNAYAAYAQVRLLYALAKEWRHDPEGKAIVCIGSITGDGDGLKDDLYPYYAWKSALDAAVRQIQKASPRLRVIMIRPGLVDTAFSASHTGQRLHASQVADIALWTISTPPDMLVRSISIAPFPQEPT